ncbi:MAG: hypothetical protein EOP84_16025 [Verrucomicrobiaceae bacterium]|nr:MAG: hypothetical protein EOP84_16025 [Verrucomicrobiaceae bacterium]
MCVFRREKTLLLEIQAATAPMLFLRQSLSAILNGFAIAVELPSLLAPLAVHVEGLELEAVAVARGKAERVEHVKGAARWAPVMRAPRPPPSSGAAHRRIYPKGSSATDYDVA